MTGRDQPGREAPREAPPERLPVVAVRGSCDLRCAWCNYAGVQAGGVAGELDRVRGELERLRAAGERRVRLGLHHTEPTRHPDLPAILRLARQLGFDDVSLSTSGIRLADPEYAGELRRQGLTSVVLTVVGLDAPRSDLLLGCDGATAAKLAAIESCLGAGLELFVVALLLRPVLRDLPPALAELSARLARPGAALHGVVPDGVPGTPPARTAALWPRYEEVAWLLARPGLPRDFFVESTDMPACARRAIPRVTGAQAARPDDGGLRFVKPARACGQCADALGCAGVEASYLAAFGDDFTGGFAAREPPRPDLDELRRLLAATGSGVGAGAGAGGAPGAPWQERALDALYPLRTDPDATVAGYSLWDLRVAPGELRLQLRAADDTMELGVGPRAAGVPCYLAGRRFAVSYRAATPPDTPPRRRLVAALLALLEGRD